MVTCRSENSMYYLVIWKLRKDGGPNFTELQQKSTSLSLNPEYSPLLEAYVTLPKLLIVIDSTLLSL